MFLGNTAQTIARFWDCGSSEYRYCTMAKAKVSLKGLGIKYTYLNFCKEIHKRHTCSSLVNSKSQ
jgi:hypothetical protein